MNIFYSLPDHLQEKINLINVKSFFLGLHYSVYKDRERCSLVAFFSNLTNLVKLTNALRGQSRVKLQLLDWLVTSYSKTHNLAFFSSYKTQLRLHKKSQFDPFLRRDKTQFIDINGQLFTTSVGQLCFFRWAFIEGVMDYLTEHAEEIEADMLLRHLRVTKTPEKACRCERTISVVV